MLMGFINGLRLLQTYYDNQDGYHVGAEHDIVYIYATDKPLPEEAVKQMVDMGWIQPEAHVPDDKDFGPEFYNAEEGWAIHV